jgi:Zn-dependent membrane protease YugP
MIWVIFIGFALASWLVGYQLKRRFKEYSDIPTSNGMSGKEVVEKMLRDHMVSGVRIQSVEGELTDHYNPADKTINLSEAVYYGKNIAAAAVAAHETGHALQHAQAYAWLGMRSALVPAVSISSKYIQWILLGGILLINTFPALLLFGIFMYALTTLFSFITLPVEINASNRALAWIKSSGVATTEMHEKAEDALRWAGYTYVVAALASLATLLYYITIFMGGRRD